MPTQSTSGDQIGKSTTSSQPTSLGRREVLGLIGWLAIVMLVAALGSLATSSSVNDWYTTLEKPWFQPPSWLFGPVWTALYIMMAISAWMVWRKRSEISRRPAINVFLAVFATQLILNLLWSVIFFGMRSPMFAFLEICILWLAIVTTTVLAFRQSQVAGWLLVPYLGWTTFALVLNLFIWRMN